MPLTLHYERQQADRLAAGETWVEYGLIITIGHARASITMDVYGQLIPSMQAEAAELIDRLVTPIDVKIDKSTVSS